MGGLTNDAKNSAASRFHVIANKFDSTTGEVSIALAAHNPNISIVITGVSKIWPLQDNLGAIDVLNRFTPGVTAQIDKVMFPLAQ